MPLDCQCTEEENLPKVIEVPLARTRAKAGRVERRKTSKQTARASMLASTVKARGKLLVQSDSANPS